MLSSAAQPSGIDAALLSARRAWFGLLFLLSRESKASSAGFAITTLADVIQFAVFPLMIAVTVTRETIFQAVATVLSIAILDVDTLFALADANSGAGRAVLFWLALAIVLIFLGLVSYVMGTIITEGRQQAIVLRALASLASVLTTVAFMPAASLMLAVFRSCGSVEALGVGCQTDGHWIVIALVVTVLTVFTAVATFFATVYIDTDLKSTALGAKVTGRVDAAMLVAKLVLVVFFTAVTLPPAVLTILAAAAALTWLLGTVFVQPHVQPMANNVAAAAAAFNAWLVLAVGVRLIAPRSSIDAFMVLGLALAPALGYFGNEAYRSSVANSDFSSLRSSLQADIWARHRVSMAQRLIAASTGNGMHRTRDSRGGQSGRRGGAAEGGRRGGRGGEGGAASTPKRSFKSRKGSIMSQGPTDGMGSSRGYSQAKRSLGRPPSLSSLMGGSMATPANGVPPGFEGAGYGPPLRVHVLADSGNNDSDSDSDDPVTTEDLLPSVTSERLIRQSAMAYDEMLKAWPKSAVTYSSGSIFHRAYGSTASSELTILAMARKQVGSAWDVSFLSYQRTRQLQERSGSGLSAVDRTLFDEAWRTAIEETTKAFAAQNKLYNHAVESNPDASRLGVLAEELFKARTAAERRFRTMLQINPDSIMALRAYSRFCEEVLHDADRATELMNKANRIEDKHAKTNVRPLDAVVVGAVEEPLSVMDEMNAVITMTGELRRYGEITDANVATARLFGRGRSDLVGQSLASLFPEPLGSLYDAAILAYLSPHEKGEAFSRGAHVSVVQTAGGWLAPVRVSLQEGAGSELDATPSLSLVVQRAPTKRRMMVVGDAESGFPVLALDVESMALLGDEAMDEEDGGDDDGYDVGSDAADGDSDGGPAGGPSGTGGGLRWTSSGAVLASGGGGGTASVIASRELPLVQWLPDLGRLASAAMGSGAGASADLVVRGSMYNEDEDADARALDVAVAQAAAAAVVPDSEDEAASVDDELLTGMAPAKLAAAAGAEDLTASPHQAIRSALKHPHPPHQPPQPRGLGALTLSAAGPKKAVKLRIGVQALHDHVLQGRRPKRDGDLPSFWLVTWEPPKGHVTTGGGGGGGRARGSSKRGGRIAAASDHAAKRLAHHSSGPRISSAISEAPSSVAGVPMQRPGRARTISSGAPARATSVGRGELGGAGKSARSAAGPRQALKMGGSGGLVVGSKTASHVTRFQLQHSDDAAGGSKRARPQSAEPGFADAKSAAGVAIEAEDSPMPDTDLLGGEAPSEGTAASRAVTAQDMRPTPKSVGDQGFFSSAVIESGDGGLSSRLLLDEAGQGTFTEMDSRLGLSAPTGVSMAEGRAPGGNSRAGSRAGGADGQGSVHSSLTSAGRVTKSIIDTALSRSDANVARIRAVTLGSLAAVIMFAVGIALVVPASDSGARLLLEANNLAQRRLYQSGTASNVRYQMTSVALGFDVINSWDELTSNLTSSVQRLEAAHRELLSVAQRTQGKLSVYQQERSWLACTASSTQHECDKRELMSSAELVEFNIYHLRQMADTTPDKLLTLPSFLVLMANINLSAMALRSAERVSALELSQGMQDRLATMSIVLISAAVATFLTATFGTTWLMAALGRQRFRLLASVPQVPRKQLRELARQAEEAQLAFARAVGADTGDDEGGMMDAVMDEGMGAEGGPKRDLTRPVAGDQFRGGGGGGGGGDDSGQAGTTDVTFADARGNGLTSGPGMPRVVRLQGKPKSAGACARCCGPRVGRRDRRVADSSCFVWKASLRITSPLSLIGAWIAVVLVMVNAMYSRITIDAARSERLHSFAAGTSALRGQLELTLQETNIRRSRAMENARTNSTRILRALSAVLNGDAETSYNVRLPSLAESKDPTAGELFQILVHDSCHVLRNPSSYYSQCRALHEHFGLSGLLSFTTAMLDDGTQSTIIFDETNQSDSRGLMQMYRSGELAPVLGPLTRYDAKGEMAEILIRHLVNVTAAAAVSRFSSTWSDVQLVLGIFAGGFVLIVWLWALPSVRQLEDSRRALYSVMLTLPDDVILSTPAVTDVLVDMATHVGLTQAARALKGLAKSAMDQGRRGNRISTGVSIQHRRRAGPGPRVSNSSKVASDQDEPLADGAFQITSHSVGQRGGAGAGGGTPIPGAYSS
ncbi:hypothetical protein FNF28_07133 [Cafeteria roenbergensis]|uniref:TmcB/TmcC TPR repeats domain-containing protein n=1 Tax=Cafeteria roenbergensis TaxID=33653 RepID=A0A5A8CFW2_CAFRO|nr:hypothetical protein FNF28_07133 [Cafeteria roenbergensis]